MYEILEDRRTRLMYEILEDRRAGLIYKILEDRRTGLMYEILEDRRAGLYEIKGGRVGKGLCMYNIKRQKCLKGCGFMTHF